MNYFKKIMQQPFLCVTEFGFINFEKFIDSLMRPKLMPLTIPLAMIGKYIEYLFGLREVVFIAFGAMLTLELASGIGASWIEGNKISSKRSKSFLMMLFVWLVVLFILNSFKNMAESVLISTAFSYLFDFTIIYVTGIYFISIIENIGRIMDRRNEFKRLSDIFRLKLIKKEEDDSKKENKKDS